MPLDSTLDTLRTLVAFDTVSSRSNQALIDWVANRLDDHGIQATIQTGDEAGKANLYATIGPDDVPGVMLSGHSDVVPVAGQDWSCDPFTLTARDDRWLARGSADMKGFIACCVDAIPRFKAAGLRTPVHLALSYNEESNMHGMRLLARQLAAAPVRPAACIIGEPTRMRVVVANKGTAIYRCRVRGYSVHSSLRHQGVSAVEMAAEVIVFLNRLQDELLRAERHDGFVRDPRPARGVGAGGARPGAPALRHRTGAAHAPRRSFLRHHDRGDPRCPGARRARQPLARRGAEAAVRLRRPRPRELRYRGGHAAGGGCAHGGLRAG